MSRKKFVLYDGRARSGDTDRAAAMDTADSEREARREGLTTWKDHDAVWFEYDFDGKEATNERMRADLPPAAPGEQQQDTEKGSSGPGG